MAVGTNPPQASSPSTSVAETLKKKGALDARTALFEKDEIVALARHAAQTGKDPKLVGEIMAALRGDESEPGYWTAVEKAYAALAAKTAPVTGRTILDSSAARRGRRIRGITWLAVVFVFLAIGNEVADRWVSDALAPEDPSFGYQLKVYLWDVLAPFCWGGLGACIYLLKRIEDQAADLQFEFARLSGWAPRIVLGAVLGAVVVMLFDPTSFTSGKQPLTSDALAFLTGLSVRVVYGAIEKMVQMLAESMNLDSLRTRGGWQRNAGK